MVNKTPLRLIAVEEMPPEDEGDESGTPVVMMSDHDAITRKVPEAEVIAAADTFREKPRQALSWKILLLTGAAVAVVTMAIFAVATTGKSTTVRAPVYTGAPVPPPVEALQPRPLVAPAAPSVASSPPSKAVPEIIRLNITAEPVETELSLDGNVLAGHRLSLEVPKDRGIHVITASAPGYIPFNQQVSFSADVLLDIGLRRTHTPPARQAGRPHPSQPDSKPKNSVRQAAELASPVLAPGMNLEGPSLHHNAKPIDERNPYQP